MMDAKALKKFVSTCRKLGVKEFTSPEFSFKLTEEAPIPQSKVVNKVMAQSPMTPHAEVDAPTLTEEQLLFWSSYQEKSENSSETQ